MSIATHAKLIAAMQQPGFYDHPAGKVELIETHISWVFLAGDFAYKLKKPVDFGFLDFSTLDKRRHCCAEELRLNRRFAPQIYLEVVPIGGAPGAPQLRGQPVLEYAVKMQRFPQTAQLDRMLAAERLTAGIIDSFASYIAKLHQSAPVASATQAFGSPQAVLEPVAENFRQTRPLLAAAEREQLSQLESWSRANWQQLKPLFQQRKAEGFIRECHGDLHLANMAWIAAEAVIFDGIEFNERLRWIDLLSDVAFLVMDLDDRGKSPLGWRFLNRYLQETGDYQGLKLLAFYKSYRAMVRAKVFCLRLAQPGLSAVEQRQDRDLYHSYLDLATSYTLNRPKLLLITHGLSGSGKSTFARTLAGHYGAIHLQSDRERKRLFGLAADAKSHSGVDSGLYSAERQLATYDKLAELAREVLQANLPVIVDATFLQAEQRQQFQRLAKQQHGTFIILDFEVPEAELRRRILHREQNAADLSEATLEVLDRQLQRQQPLTQQEQAAALPLDSTSQPAEIAAKIKTRISSQQQLLFGQ